MTFEIGDILVIPHHPNIYLKYWVISIDNGTYEVYILDKNLPMILNKLYITEKSLFLGQNLTSIFRNFIR